MCPQLREIKLSVNIISCRETCDQDQRTVVVPGRKSLPATLTTTTTEKDVENGFLFASKCAFNCIYQVCTIMLGNMSECIHNVNFQKGNSF